MSEKMRSLANAVEVVRSHQDRGFEERLSNVFGALSEVLNEHGFGYASCVSEELRVSFSKHLVVTEDNHESEDFECDDSEPGTDELHERLDSE